jgi:predicted transcriptional regulator
VSADQKIKQTLADTDSPISTRQVSEHSNIGWHKAKETLEELHDAGEIGRREMNNRLTLWWDREIPF